MVVQFVDVGKQWVVDKMDDSSATTMNKVAWGTGATVPTEASTQLSTEASEARVTATLSQQQTVIVGDTYQAIGTLTAAGSKTITNAGLFDSGTAGAGSALIIGDHAGVPLLLNDSIEYTFKLQVKM